MTGSSSWQESGKREHEQGKAECDYARFKARGEGTTVTDRVTGMKDTVVGASTGSQSGERPGKA